MESQKLISVIMGSQSDWATMQFCTEILEKFAIPYEKQIISAHRTPDRLREFAKNAQSRGVQVIIAGAGGAAHLAGMCAAQTNLPVLGVPVNATCLAGVDSVMSILQMPAGVPVGTLAIGKAGAINAALLAIAILALTDAKIAQKYQDYRQNQTENVPHEISQ